MNANVVVPGAGTNVTNAPSAFKWRTAAWGASPVGKIAKYIDDMGKNMEVQKDHTENHGYERSKLSPGQHSQ